MGLNIPCRKKRGLMSSAVYYYTEGSKSHISPRQNTAKTSPSAVELASFPGRFVIESSMFAPFGDLGTRVGSLIQNKKKIQPKFRISLNTFFSTYFLISYDRIKLALGLVYLSPSLTPATAAPIPPNPFSLTCLAMVEMETDPDLDVQPDSHIDQAVSIDYWNSVPATANGMLGGYPQISSIDLRGSSTFLAKVRRLIPSSGSGELALGVDCGAGIGRVTEGFLSRVCGTVDIVEPVEKFVDVIKRGKLYQEGKIGDIYITGIQDWTPTKRYDLIWTQWCANHLTDAQLVEYLVRCKGALSEKGLLVLKENLNSDTANDYYDAVDSTVTRTESKFKKLFAEAGLKVLRSEEQSGMPQRLQLLPIRLWALRPTT
ncbi:DUF858 domain-containing protein [Blastomyces gilchristii SLH14081]|uniref:Alpha N-terminal protein methyltransferase 1 n=3 Tax=Blastomyces TaxID=229219 RepID=A0A179U9K0_BLAGS|nr:DUF858 domain-containing protein [Blastomyces gilchristii SLH14081]OAT03837.1 DUF858 domain-containing protein [Blastomyces gilchristii SLH14081]